MSFIRDWFLAAILAALLTGLLFPNVAGRLAAVAVKSFHLEMISPAGGAF